MNQLASALSGENGALRGLAGSGQPGLWTLLGGTGAEADSNTLTFTGGAGQVSAVAKLARAYRDTRVAQIASGNSRPGYPTGRGGDYVGQDTSDPRSGPTRRPTRRGG